VSKPKVDLTSHLRSSSDQVERCFDSEVCQMGRERERPEYIAGRFGCSQSRNVFVETLQLRIGWARTKRGAWYC